MNMASWKILIADDEKEARELLLHYLDDHQYILQVKESRDGESTLKMLQEFQPDILFLDIKMPEITGLEVLQKRTPSALPAIIFTTAFDEYALPAFDNAAIDYLLKPFEKERFDKALQRAMDYVQLVKNKKDDKYPLHIPVTTGSRTQLIPVDHVQYFQADGAYVQVITENKNYLITESVYELEEMLDPAHFARVHRSVIVNLGCIKSIRSLLNGDHMLLLKNGKEIRASRTYKDKIKALK
jgi:two-component system, LytTR family, response regulator